jgi:MFS family permease
MKKPWFKNTISIASIFSFRMLGLFMLIPVFTIYAHNLNHATPALIGIALGSYGLTQSILQIPFGMLSDKFGRKPIITLGLVLFSIGSIIGAYTTSIEGMILARALQGTGAIGSVLIALLTDITPDEHRTKAMAVVGSTIGISFSLSIIISPYITSLFGLSGIFYITAALAILGIIIVNTVIPTPQDVTLIINKAKFNEIIFNKDLVKNNIGIFIQHLLLTTTFFVLPLILQAQIKNNNLSSLWHFYLPIIVLSFLVMMPLIIYAERVQKIKQIFMLAVVFIFISQIFLIISHNNFTYIAILIFVYLLGFNILEAMLPSIVSKQANIHNRGSVMGVYSSFQFLGIFAGGCLAGFIFKSYGYLGVFIFNTIVSLLWIIVAKSMQPERYHLLISIPITNILKCESEIIKALQQIDGVIQASIELPKKLVHLEVEKPTYKNDSANKILKSLEVI